MSNKNEIIAQIVNKLFKNENNNYIFIYTPPKVGSTTLVSSLRISLGKSYNIIHIHDEVMLEVLTGITNVTINDILNYLSNARKNVYVIDVYRTPIERKMSAFFEKIAPYHFNNLEENIKNYSIQRVSNRFNKVFPFLESGDHYFDKYNISDPVPFDFTKKYTVQEVNKIKYIKLRLCDTHVWDTVLSEIFHSDIVLISDYKTENKTIGELYNKFKNQYRLPLNFLEDIKSCKYLNFYYNEEEKDTYLNFWKRRVCNDVVPYTSDEFNFYMTICLENQYINDIQGEHYIDNGCFCKYCINKRRDIFFRAKNGEKHFDKIIHSDVVHEVKQKTKKKVLDAVNHKIMNTKFKPKQFKIKIGNA
jgi:hypothetical protein